MSEINEARIWRIAAEETIEQLRFQRDAAVAENARLLARIAAVEALHFTRGRNILGKPVCAECSPLQPMPCPTLRALAASPTPTGPEPATKPKRCAGTLGDRPSWMSPGQFSPCHCELLDGHDGECQCEHTRPATPEPID